MTLPVGSRLGVYEIVGPLGAGGMGEVYRARDPRLGREVAVKVLAEAADGDDERLARFAREGRAAAAINHPNVLTVHDLGVHQGRPFLVTELVAGESLRERLRRGPLPAAEAVELARQLAAGVAAAHAAGVVHRDLKPENLVVTPAGTLKILDFGVARLRPPAPEAEATTLSSTGAGAALGTLSSMAPEQLRGEEVDGRADLFAVGVILYETLSGARPFARATAAATAAAVLHEQPPPLDERAPDVPPSLARLVERCLAKDPAERFQSARDLAFALATAAADAAAPAPWRRPPARTAEPGSIAVLPFADLSPARDQEYFCDGLAEELLDALSRVEGLRVVARSSSFQLRGTAVDARAAGERLGAAWVLEGSVRKAGERLRVSVRLVDVADGYQRWSERFDRQLEDVFAIQDEIARSVVGCVGERLGVPLASPAAPRAETRIEAYEHVLRGRHLLHQLRRRPLEGAIEAFHRALASDPAYAPAWAGIAEAHAWLYQWFGGGEHHLAEAERASERAAALGPELASVHVARGLAHALRGRYPQAEAALAEATRLDPRSFDAWYHWGRTSFESGRTERSAELFRRAAEVRQEDFQAPILLAQSLRVLGRDDEADAAVREGIRRAERRLDLDPTDSRALSLGGSALADAGDAERAVAWTEKALELYPGEGSVVMNAICAYAKLGRIEPALDLLERAVEQGFGKRDWIEHDPDYDPLRGHPRFEELLARSH
ncbi:MAG TPA: protein kinase [Thermoanaerobaculia bacterium]